MNKNDQELAQAVRQAAGEDPAPPNFEALWSRARGDYERSRRRYSWLASAAATVAAVVVTAHFVTRPGDDTTYIEVAELLDGTSWTAPSDVLMPEHQFDIYEELPTLTRSTKPAEGALL
jgi:hypothetical protein